MLNPSLDAAALADDFRRLGRIRIPDVLLPEAAAALHACLQTEIPWRLYCYDNRQPPKHRALKLRREDLAAMSPEQRQGLQSEILRQARDRFQYVYQAFDLIEGHRRGEQSGLFAYQLMPHLAGGAFGEGFHIPVFDAL